VTSRQRLKAERRWRRIGLAADLRAFKDLRNESNNLMNVARKVFYKDLIDKSSGDQKKPFLGNEETAWRGARYSISSF